MIICVKLGCGERHRRIVVLFVFSSLAFLSKSFPDPNEGFTEFVGTFAEGTFTPVVIIVRIDDVRKPCV